MRNTWSMEKPDSITESKSADEAGFCEDNVNESGEINEAEILSGYTMQQQTEIMQKRRLLSSLAYFIGKDFQIPVELNNPNCGWQWDITNNVIRIDPETLLNKPIDYLRYLISHEGGHKRITRFENVDIEEWNQPGFSFMMNVIEDPRTDNFVAESYPKFREQMNDFYDFETGGDVNKNSQQPYFIQAGLEYLKQWHRETQGLDFELTEDLPDEVKQVVSQTINSAKDSWWRYPSRQEADASEAIIGQYSQVSYEINRDMIWPQFKKLVEIDIENQSIKEYAKDLNQSAENDELDVDDLSDELRQQIAEEINKLTPEQQSELFNRVIEVLSKIEQEFNDVLSGKLVNIPGNGQDMGEQDDQTDIEQLYEVIEELNDQDVVNDELNIFKSYIEKELQKDSNDYEKIRRPLIPLIDRLESDLRDIFVVRRNHSWQTGFKTGQKVDIGKRIQEKAKSISVIDSKSWSKRELPDEKDYAISILVDLSGTMGSDKKINETFNGVVVLTEALSRLSIKHEIVGFNSQFHEYKSFDEQINKDIRNQMTDMLNEVRGNNASYTDDGWALIQASERLASQKTANQKLLIVLSDGQPNESPDHDKPEFALPTVISLIEKNTDIRLIGLGVGRGTEHVKDYYHESIANVQVKEMSNKLAGIIVDAIAK